MPKQFLVKGSGMLQQSSIPLDNSISFFKRENCSFSFAAIGSSMKESRIAISL
jgi:hypothetical protein